MIMLSRIALLTATLMLAAPLSAATLAGRAQVSVLQPLRVEHMSNGAVRIESPTLVRIDRPGVRHAPYHARQTQMLANASNTRPVTLHFE